LRSNLNAIGKFFLRGTFVGLKDPAGIFHRRAHATGEERGLPMVRVNNDGRHPGIGLENVVVIPATVAHHPNDPLDRRPLQLQRLRAFRFQCEAKSD